MKFQINGVVLKELPMGEKDKIITVLTAERGLLSVFCRGVRVLTSRHFSLCRPFVYGDFIISEDGKNGYFYLSEGTVIDYLCSDGTALEAIALRSYIAEVASSVTSEEADEGGMLRLTLNSLWAIGNTAVPLPFIKAAFELRTVVICGYMPELSGCAICGAEHEDGYFFDIMNGVIRGRGCICGKDSSPSAPEEFDGTAVIIVPVSRAAVEIMRKIISAPPKRALEFAKGEFSAETEENLAEACEKFLLNQIERGFETLDFYKMLTKKLKK